jgi:predicted nuclease with TOPRIM domain
MSSSGGEDTLAYWKEKYEAISSEYDEFQKQSSELEKELELELEQEKDKCKELQKASARLHADNDTLKSAIYHIYNETNKNGLTLAEKLNQTHAWATERFAWSSVLEKLSKCVRDP